MACEDTMRRMLRLDQRCKALHVASPTNCLLFSDHGVRLMHCTIECYLCALNGCEYVCRCDRYRKWGFKITPKIISRLQLCPVTYRIRVIHAYMYAVRRTLIADSAYQLGTSTDVLQLRSSQPLLRVRCVVASAHHLKYRDIGKEGASAIQFASREIPAAARHSAPRSTAAVRAASS